MDIVDILKDLMSPRSNSDLTTPTACNVGGSGGFGRNVSGSGKGTRTGVRLPDSFDYEEDSTIVHLLPTETESTEEYYDDDDSNLFHDVNMDDEDESTIIQHLPGSDHNNTYNDHHQLLQHDDIEKVVPRHHSTSPQPRHHSPSPPPTTYQLQHPAVGTSITNLLHQQHQHQHPIPSLLSSSEDDTEEEEDIDEMEEEDSTIVQPLPGQDDSTAVAAAVTAATTAAALQQQQMQRGSISFNSSCNSSRSLPLREVFMKNKKTDSYNDNNTEVGGGVEIVDVIMEHFDFSPEWEDVGAVGASGFGSCGGGDAVVGEKKVVVDDDSTVVQHLPGEEDTYNDDDNISDIVFADRRMRHSKNGQKGAGQSTSLTKKATTAAAVFVTLTVCLGVGYKAGNIMTLGGSNTSSSSSVAVLTPDDCLALRNVTATHENNSSGKQRLRRRIEESSWQRIFSKCDELLGPQQTQDESSNNNQSETNNTTEYTIFKGKAQKQSKSSKTVKPEPLDTTKQQQQQKGSKSSKPPPTIVGASSSSSLTDTTSSSPPFVNVVPPISKGAHPFSSAATAAATTKEQITTSTSPPTTAIAKGQPSDAPPDPLKGSKRLLSR